MGAALKMQEDPEEFSSGSSWSSKIIIRDYWEWSYLGLCRNPKISKLFGLTKKINQAKAWCGACPVQEDCLIWAVIYQESGVWGGTTDSEREKLFSKKDREELIEIAKQQENYYRRETPGALIQQLNKHQQK